MYYTTVLKITNNCYIVLFSIKLQQFLMLMLCFFWCVIVVNCENSTVIAEVKLQNTWAGLFESRLTLTQD